MTASNPSVRQVHLDKMLTLLSDPPSLNDVAIDSAQAYLDLYFAERHYNAGHLYIVAPGKPYRSLSGWVLERLCVARPTLLVEQFHQVLQRVREDYVPAGPSLAELELLINRCGAGLLGLYARRLQAWWREGLPVNMTRWGYVSDELLKMFYDSPRPPGMSQARFDTVFPKAHVHPIRPDRLWSAHGATLRVQTVQVQQPAQSLPLLLFNQPSQPGFLLFSPASGIQWLDSFDALQALLPAYTPTVGQWFTADVQGDPFDALAACYLQRQLQEIASLSPRVPRSLEDYQALLSMITDSRRWFVVPLSERQLSLQEKLPLWLAHADADACIAYAQLLQALVLDRQQQGTADFLDGIPTLKDYANEQLHTCLRQEPRAATLSPGDINLTFDRVIAAAVPSQGGFIAGEVERIEVTLTELALENLAGFPYTAKAIRPAWLSYDTLKAWVTHVDVGQAYPALLKKHLIENAAEVARRRQRFSRQLRLQLPMQALEWHIKGEHGLTREGFRRLRAALQASAAVRQGMALWPLAFKATATSAVDTVANMFVIGPHHGQDGCHLLYRPSFEPSLLEFESLDTLFEAIKQPGAIQDSVLTWIASRRQAVYANNGFREPHVRHFLPGDVFYRYDKPAPAQLSKTVSGTDPAHQLFAAMAQALVALADRQSVSNAEQRWASLKHIGWLVFGTLQPLLSGPLMLAGWLVQLMSSAAQDIANLQSTDPQARSAALLDMLVNLMVIVAHQATPHDGLRHLELEHPVFAPQVDPVALPTRRIQAPEQFVAPAGWANARDVLTPALQARLDALSLKRFPAPWPKVLPGAEPRGQWQGLLQVGQQWQALVRGQQFRVRMEQGRVRVVSADGRRVGPWLKAVGPGLWDIDLQLRLSGGADDAAPAPLDRQQLEAQYQQAAIERTRAQRVMEIARNLTLQSGLDEQQLSSFQARYRQALEDKVQHSIKELQMLRRLRELAPRPRYEEELSQLLESIVLTLQLLDIQLSNEVRHTKARVVPLLKRSDDDSGDEQAHAALNQGMRALAASYASAIRWRSQEDRYLNELREVPRFGRDKSAALLAQTPARPSLLDLQSLQLSTLWGLAIDTPSTVFEDDLFERLSTTVLRARWASRSLAERAQVQASDAEQIELLDSIDHIFAQTDDQIEFWRAMEPERFDLEYLEKLQQLLTGLHQQVERDLSALLQPASVEGPLPPPAASPRKKIIRTRNRDLLVARTEPATRTTAQLTDASGRVIGTFTEADDGVWEPVPAPARPDPELGSLVKTAQALLQDVDNTIAKVDTLAARANTPASLQDVLEAEARRRLWVANKIREKLNDQGSIRLAAVQQTKARTAEAELRKVVTRLEAAGLAARIRATLSKPLNQDDVAFLHQQHQVSIVREGSRVALKGRREDYLQVYAVNDAHTGKALAYAHFHYACGQGPDDHFTAAHLKTPEQARLGRQAQAHAEAQAFARMRMGQTGRVQQTLQIHRSEIQLPLARRLFFSAD